MQAQNNPKRFTDNMRKKVKDDLFWQINRFGAAAVSLFHESFRGFYKQHAAFSRAIKSVCIQNTTIEALVSDHLGNSEKWS